MNNNANNELIIKLGLIKNIGTKSIINILPLVSKNINLTLSELKEIIIDNKNISKRIKTIISNIDIITWNNATNNAKEVLNEVAENNIKCINFLNDDYPISLRVLNNFPPLLFIKGNDELLSDMYKRVAVVGTRNPSSASIKYTKRFVDKAVENNFVIVGGLALGIDTVGHQQTVENNGNTIAILGNGLNAPIYPAKNKLLAKKIIETGGALISTYLPDVSVSAINLVQRDTWQSGISDGVFAAETSLHGGTLHAMNAAINQNRPLAVLDFRKFPNFNSFKLDDNIQGNLKYINNKNALPLFDSDSLQKFFSELSITHEKINKIYAEQLNFKQETLF